MQITNSVVCDASKGCIYKQIKPPLVGGHAFPLMGFVCMAAHVTFGGSGGIRSTAMPDRGCLTHVFPRPSLGTRLLGGGRNVTVRSTDINRYANYKLGSL